MQARREALVGAWVSQVMASYSAPIRTALARRQDPFRNPAGSVVRETLGVLLDAIIGDADLTRAEPTLAELIRLRAVQGLPADEAVAFLRPLKKILLDAATDLAEPPAARKSRRPDAAGPVDGEQVSLESAIARYDGRIDRLASAAALLYAQCRERIEALKRAEVNRRDFVRERMAARRTGVGNQDSRIGS